MAKMIAGRGKNKRMNLNYVKSVIRRQYSEGQMGFSMQMYKSYRLNGGRMTYQEIIKSVKVPSHRKEFNKSYFDTYKKNYNFK